MKKGIIPVICLIVLCFGIVTQGQKKNDKAEYKGVEHCKTCHGLEKNGMQNQIWEKSGHARAYTILTSEKMVEMAKKRGQEQMPYENPSCLKCHGPLSETAPQFIKEGVSCEICHDPAHDHDKIKKDKQESFCMTCHEKAHGKTFNFKSAWEKIKHPMPPKNN